MAPTAHSKLGGSGCSRWVPCPGSVAMNEKLPEPPESPYAAEGSAAHELAEQCLTENVPAEDLVGRTYRKWANYPVTEEMAAAVQVYLDFCNSFGFEFSDIETWVEKRFRIWEYDHRFWGMSDFGAYIPATREMHVVDYKHGAGVKVYVKRNYQLQFYGLGALGEFDKPVDVVHLHIVQPRAGHKEAVNSWTTTPQELHDFGEYIAEAALETDKPNAKRVPGKHCQFCKGAMLFKCEEWMGWKTDLDKATEDFFGHGGTTKPVNVSGRRNRNITNAETDFQSIAGLIE